MGLVLLVRHGQASFGANDYDVLSETGWAQGRALGAWLSAHDVVPTALVRGGLRRHRETLEAMSEGAGWSASLVPDVDPEWDEFDHVSLVSSYAAGLDGAPSDLDRRGFQRLFEQATARWTAGESEGYSETYAAFVARSQAALGRARERAGSGETVVVVSSGGPIAVCCAALVDPGEQEPASLARLWTSFNTVAINTGVTRVVVGGTGARLLTFNEHPHLEPDLLTYR